MKTREQKIINWLEKTIVADYLGNYSNGHMGAVIARFKRKSDEQLLIAKFNSKKSTPLDSINDIKNNIIGYELISKNGGCDLIPENFTWYDYHGEPIIIMRDLGNDFKKSARNISIYLKLSELFEVVIKKSLSRVANINNVSNISKQPLYFIHKYAALLDGIGTSDEIKKICSWTPEIYLDRVSIMLLDFTPDNVFVSEDKISFIDPWGQKTYLGHPAISLGQFSTLAYNVYNLPFSKEGTLLLKELAVKKCSKILCCDAVLSEKAFIIGSVLQLTLSAFVRKDNDKEKARFFIHQILDLIDKNPN